MTQEVEWLEWNLSNEILVRFSRDAEIILADVLKFQERLHRPTTSDPDYWSPYVVKMQAHRLIDIAQGYRDDLGPICGNLWVGSRVEIGIRRRIR